MFKKKPVLKYESALEEYPDIISTAKSNIPDWYKKIPKWYNNEMFSAENGLRPTIKNCIPFLDSMTSGYVVKLAYDLYVHDNNGAPYLVWKNIENPPKWRTDIATPNNIPAGHYPAEYLWNLCVSFEVPKGYSMLLTHPLNRHDLPFTTLSGIIDGDFATNSNGNYPFYLKEGFFGIIEKGTPIMQIIPFKQESWKAEKTEGILKRGLINHKLSSAKISGFYKKTFWNRKSYE